VYLMSQRLRGKDVRVQDGLPKVMVHLPK
jgi:hypothetical protein